MRIVKQSPRQSLDPAFRRLRPSRALIDKFKGNLILLLGKIDEREHEEHVKNQVRDFLLNTYYRETNEVNTKGDEDLAIHIGTTNKTPVGVIIEAKRPKNTTEWFKGDNANCKAFQELVLYYLRERDGESKNTDIQYLIATNINEWYIFKAAHFEDLFYNTPFLKEYQSFVKKQKVTTKTNLFYDDLAKPYIDSITDVIPCTYFDIRDFDRAIRNVNKQEDKNLISLVKILSPNHLLNVEFADDSNSLKESFYKELLHIIGLEERKEDGKNIIGRKKEGSRNGGALIENAITLLDTENPLYKIADLQVLFGLTRDEQLYNIAFELCITWINRILFLKLLEGQLVNYHKNNTEYIFLNSTIVPAYSELHKLFHQVLAKTPSERSPEVSEKYSRVPYLNSSLFEFSKLEDQTIKINALDPTLNLDLMGGTILKEIKKRKSALPALDYLFRFLSAFDFATEGGEEIQEDENRTLINASVLGKVFEKINGYKDGSVFTPGFITKYMCGQAIRDSLAQKFKEKYNWKIKHFGDLYNYLQDRRGRDEILEDNAIINSLRLCDPGVGSGHFLVSSLNEIIAIKSELGLLADEKGVRHSEYQIVIAQDELIITDQSGNDFKYEVINGKPITKEMQRLQETLFREKQTIIENCLFGVDINPKSVMICRLRLWIELLKNAYYKEETRFLELETLPNIDINIKCGNSLISRFPLDEDLSMALKGIKYNVQQYRAFVSDYKNEKNREVKRGLEVIIDAIKNDFRTEIYKNDSKVVALNKKNGELYNLQNQTKLFALESKEKKVMTAKKEKLESERDKLYEEIEEIKGNVVFKNAFEWRFEFPEVLDNDGNYVGFDLIIGNPPYVVSRETFSDMHKNYYLSHYNLIHEKPNLYLLFIEKSLQLLKPNGEFAFIVPNSITGVESAVKVRELLINRFRINSIVNLLGETFKNVGVESCLLFLSNKAPAETVKYLSTNTGNIQEKRFNEISISTWRENRNYLFDISSSNADSLIITKIKNKSQSLFEQYDVRVGLQAYETGKGNPRQSVEDVRNHVYDFDNKVDENTYPYLNGADIGRYKFNWSGQWLRYGEWLSQPKTLSQFTLPRILIREITGKFPFVMQAMYVTGAYLNNKSILNVLPKTDEYSLLFLCGYLNSKLISFYHKRQTVKGDRKLFPKIVIKDLQNYPIPKVDLKAQQPVIDLVNKIISQKLSGNTNTESLETEIDNLVFDMYEFTSAERDIVNG